MPNIPVPKNPWAAWAIDAAERGLRAYCAAFASIAGADHVFHSFDASLAQTAYAALVGLLVSTAFSFAGKARGAPDSASLLSREKDPPLHHPRAKR